MASAPVRLAFPRLAAHFRPRAAVDIFFESGSLFADQNVVVDDADPVPEDAGDRRMTRALKGPEP